MAAFRTGRFWLKLVEPALFVFTFRLEFRHWCAVPQQVSQFRWFEERTEVQPGVDVGLELPHIPAGKVSSAVVCQREMPLLVVGQAATTDGNKVVASRFDDPHTFYACLGSRLKRGVSSKDLVVLVDHDAAGRADGVQRIHNQAHISWRVLAAVIGVRLKVRDMSQFVDARSESGRAASVLRNGRKNFIRYVAGRTGSLSGRCLVRLIC
jgi:hypothetical protein